MKKNLTTWEAACIITGYGIGAGILSMPWLAAKCGILISVLILIIAFAASYILHLMIADLSLKTDNGGQIISCLSRFLFKGKFKKFLSILFFSLMTVIFITNLAAYISGAEEVIIGLIPIPRIAAVLIFYAVAASVVLFGLKAVGISEKYAVAVIFGLIITLAGASFLAKHNPIPLKCESLNAGLAYFGMAMFSLAAFFSVPQAVEGLNGDNKKIKKAVFLGLFNDFVIILIISFCSLWASAEITEVAMVGWSKGIGLWAQIVGSIFTILAMLTTYWSLSLALSGIVEEMLHPGEKISWLIATLPSLVLLLFNLADFMELMRTAGGLIAIIISVMIVPAYRNAKKEIPGSVINHSSTVLDIFVIVAYIFMAIGSVVPV